MANPSKRRGSKFEVDVCAYLNDRGIPCERRVTRGKNDAGDVAGIPSWVLELKATKQIDLASAQKEAKVEAENAAAPYYASIHKKRNAPIADAYVVLPLSIWTDYYLAVHGAREGVS